jgi:hypothetical protein
MRKNVDSEGCLEPVLGPMIACWELRAGIQNKPIDFSLAELLDDGLREFADAGETSQIERNCFNLARRAPARADDQAGIFGAWPMSWAAISPRPDVPPVMMMVFTDSASKCRPSKWAVRRLAAGTLLFLHNAKAGSGRYILGWRGAGVSLFLASTEGTR